MAAAARSSSLAPSSSAHGSERIGMGAVEIGSGAGGGGAAGGGAGAGGGGAGAGTGAQAARRATDSKMRANFEIMASLPLARLPAPPCVSPRGAGKSTDHPANRGAPASIAARQPTNRGACQSARGGAAQRAAGRRGRWTPMAVRRPMVVWRAPAGSPLSRRRTRPCRQHCGGNQQGASHLRFLRPLPWRKSRGGLSVRVKRARLLL
jgi:hypothetical protein